MIGRWVVAAALGVGASVTCAFAADLAPPPTPPQADPAPACDFFQAELIGVLCGHTAFVSPGVTGGQYTINRTTVIPAGPGGFHGVGGGALGSTTVDHWTYQNVYESMTLAISPWQGVRFHVTGEAYQYNDSYSSLFTPGGGGGFHDLSTTASRDGSYAGWQEIGGEATLWDAHMQTPFGAMHYVLDVIGNLEFLPSGGAYQGRDLQQVGWQSGASLPIGASGLSLAYLSANLFEHLDNPGFDEYANTTRVLLASDNYGWAIGPRLEGTTVLWHAPGAATGWFETRLGGEVLAQPFRLTSYPVLRDLTLDLTATHSLGQAALVPNWAGASSQYVYSATARVNFRF